MKKMPGAGAIALICLLSSGAAAQTVVATAIVAGERVELLSNRTWRPVDADAASGCIPILEDISACLEGAGWSVFHDAPRDRSLQLRLDATAYALIIIDEVGTADGVTFASMRDVKLSNAAQAANIPTRQVAVHGAATTYLLGQTTEQTVYSVPINGIDVLYSNTVMLLENETIQFVTYTIGPSRHDRFGDVHASFLSLLQRD